MSDQDQERTILLRNSPTSGSETRQGSSYDRTLARYRDELINMAGEYMRLGMQSASQECLAQAGRMAHILTRRQRALRRYGC
jgi:hypothetical protein